MHNEEINSNTQHLSFIHFEALKRQQESIKQRKVRNFVLMNSFDF